MGSVFHSDSSSLPLLVSSPLTSLLTRWPVLSNYCLSFFLSLSATLMPLLPCGSLHAIPLFLISFIEIARQKSLLITYKFPRWSLLMKWSQKRFDKKKKKSNDWKYRGMLYREGGDLLTALPSVSNYFVQMSRHSWTCSRCSRRAVQSAEQKNAKCIGEPRLSALSEILSHSQFSVRQPLVQCVPIESHNS